MNKVTYLDFMCVIQMVTVCFFNFWVTFSGLSYKRPSLRSRSCCPSPSWMGTRRRCWPIRPRLPGSCAISCRTKSGSRISSGSHSTLHFLTRYCYKWKTFLRFFIHAMFVSPNNLKLIFDYLTCLATQLLSLESDEYLLFAFNV